MRLKERIPIFLELIDMEQLKEKWGFKTCYCSIEHIKAVWEKEPDQRFGQLLINLGCVNDDFILWNMEDNEFLLEQGIDPKEFLLWESHYDKNGIKLDKSIVKLAKDLDTDHIKNILKSKLVMITDGYRNVFNEILKERNQS